MATYRYQSLGNGAGGNGTVAGATIEATDRASAVRELIRRGQTPTLVELVADAAETGVRIGAAAEAAPTGIMQQLAAGLAKRRTMSRAEMAAFVRELATAVQAGLPLVHALRAIARQGRSPRQKAMLDRIIAEVEGGKSLAEAATAWGRPFSELTINLIRAGEVSGRLSEVLAQAAELLDRDVKLRRQIMAATLYPVILACLIVIAITVVVTVIVPRIVEPLAGQVLVLPWPTRVLQGVAGVVGGYWWAIALTIVLASYAAGRWYAQPAPRMWTDRRLLHTPILGRLLRDVAVARFTRTLGTLTSAGIPALQALRITKGTLNNKAMEQVIDEVCEQVSAGKTIADPMERSGYFPPMLVQIVNLGERSGRLDQMLTQAAGAFEDRTETSVKLFTTALPPLMVVVMACVVGFVVMAILLPMLEFQDLVGRL